MIEKIQYITQDNAHLSHVEQASAMFDNGIKWVQLRMKDADRKTIFLQAEKIMQQAEKYGAMLILNDAVDLAKELGIKAIHLGLKDMPIDKARKMLGYDVVIGGTANTFEQVQLQMERGADYVGVGPFRFTTTKKNLSPVLGLEGYKILLSEMKKERIDIPVFVVGGVTIADIEPLKQVGVEHFAISGELLNLYLEDGNLNKLINNIRT